MADDREDLQAGHGAYPPKGKNRDAGRSATLGGSKPSREDDTSGAAEPSNAQAEPHRSSGGGGRSAQGGAQA